jgi:RAD50-interacting protein 1
LSQTLLGPIALLSSQLNFLRTTLSRTKLIALYRRIASRMSEYILHREIIYRGRHRITAREGKTIAAECELWVETCHAALASSANRNTVEAPWLKLLQAGRLVGLEGPGLTTALDETFGVHDDEVWEECLLQLVGVSEIGRETVGVILRLREGQSSYQTLLKRESDSFYHRSISINCPLMLQRLGRAPSANQNKTESNPISYTQFLR